MQMLNPKRILLVDDNAAIHEDFRKVLVAKGCDKAIDALKADLFGELSAKQCNIDGFALDSAYQGEAAIELVKQSLQDNCPYAMAFVDIRMPPGLDGITTIQKIWELDPDMQIVICTVHTDFSWEEILKKFNYSNNFLILKKPFEVVEIRQMAAALTQKWFLHKEVQYQNEHLQNLMAEHEALKATKKRGEKIE